MGLFARLLVLASVGLLVNAALDGISCARAPAGAGHRLHAPQRLPHHCALSSPLGCADREFLHASHQAYTRPPIEVIAQCVLALLACTWGIVIGTPKLKPIRVTGTREMKYVHSQRRRSVRAQESRAHACRALAPLTQQELRLLCGTTGLHDI